MRNGLKRALSAALTVLMLLTLVPAGVATEVSDNYVVPGLTLAADDGIATAAIPTNYFQAVDMDGNSLAFSFNFSNNSYDLTADNASALPQIEGYEYRYAYLERDPEKIITKVERKWSIVWKYVCTLSDGKTENANSYNKRITLCYEKVETSKSVSIPEGSMVLITGGEGTNHVWTESPSFVSMETVDENIVKLTGDSIGGPEEITHTWTDANGEEKSEVFIISVTEVAPQYVVVGSTLNLTGTSGEGHTWTSNDASIASVVDNGNTAVVTGVQESEQLVTITHTWTSSGIDMQEIFKVIVNPVGTVKVYVYVASEGMSDEMLDLLGIASVDTNNYFPAGEIYLTETFFGADVDTDNPGTPYINDESDWNAMIAALSRLNTSTLTGRYAQNQGNHVDEYIGQAVRVYGGSWGQQTTALFRWHYNAVVGTKTEHCGFADQSVKFHLDLKFNTKTITFKAGNNGIASGSAKDGTTFDHRTYITGSEIQHPRNLYIPDGYRFMGYYMDADFTKIWEGIGTPLDEDQVVYVKITPYENIVIQYTIASGEGELSEYDEALNPKTGVPVGSVPTPDDGWIFDGWYKNEDCTELVDSSWVHHEQHNNTLIPEMTGHSDNNMSMDPDMYESATYYAKFTQGTTTVNISKIVSGNMGDRSKDFYFTVSVKQNGVDAVYMVDSTPCTGSSRFTMKHGGAPRVLSQVPIGATLTITEDVYSDYNTSYSINGANSVSGNSVEWTVALPSESDENGNDIVFTNTKTGTVDTGILLDSLPYILIMGVVAVLGGGMVFRRRRARD